MIEGMIEIIKRLYVNVGGGNMLSRCVGCVRGLIVFVVRWGVLVVLGFVGEMGLHDLIAFCWGGVNGDDKSRYDLLCKVCVEYTTMVLKSG